MQIASFKGLHNLDKLKSIGIWSLDVDFDVLCLKKEHTFHSFASKTCQCHQYLMFYGGYSRTLTLVENTLDSRLTHKHPSGIRLAIKANSEFAISICMATITITAYVIFGTGLIFSKIFRVILL